MLIRDLWSFGSSRQPSHKLRKIWPITSNVGELRH